MHKKEMTFEEKQAKVADFCPIDDVFFEVMARDKKVCQEILQTILGDDALIVERVIVQDSEKNLYGRSVRLDALCRLGNGKIVNIEVQKADDDNHLKRMRYNASLLTVTHSQTGEPFSDIKDVCIVYLSKRDFLKGGHTVYHVNSVIEETGERLDDGLTRIFVNTAIDDKSKTARLMQNFKKKEVNDPEFPEMTRRVNELKHVEGGLNSMCDVMKRYEEQAAEQGRQEGRLEGRQEGRQEGRREGRQEGRQEGEQLLSSLIQTLILAGKQDEIGLVTSDAKIRQDYYQKYHIC